MILLRLIHYKSLWIYIDPFLFIYLLVNCLWIFQLISIVMKSILLIVKIFVTIYYFIESLRYLFVIFFIITIIKIPNIYNFIFMTIFFVYIPFIFNTQKLFLKINSFFVFDFKNIFGNFIIIIIKAWHLNEIFIIQLFVLEFLLLLIVITAMLFGHM